MIEPRELENHIAEAYRHQLSQGDRANKLGWRLLYSPERVLKGAKVAFIGFNPGGSYINPTHGEFSCESGSAYRKEVELWGTNSGLQEQAMALFGRLGVVPEDVLAGNLVPFRSPDEKSLKNREEAIALGRSVWRRILEVAKPSLVVSFGDAANTEVSKVLAVKAVKKLPVGWGNYTASRGQFANGAWVGLPHLSRFRIMKRPESKKQMDALFHGLCGNI